MAEEAANAEGAAEVEDEYKFQPAELNNGLLAAAKLGNRSLVAKCIAAGAHVDYADSKNWTALHYASFYGHHRVVELLLQHGAGEQTRMGVESPTDGNSSPGRNNAHATSTRIVNSPLHHAVSKMHIRCAWALLQAGFSPLDVDQYGNNCLHLAAASSVPHRALQLEMLRTLMTVGHDAGLRNWLGQTPLQVLPLDAVEARKLLQSSMVQTKCAVTGTPFGQDKLRHMCHASGRFVCEDAAVAANTKAFAPALMGTTISGDLPSPAVSLAEPFPYAQGVGGLPVAVLAQDTALTRPVRYAAEVSYKVTDAEAGLETALEPFTAAVSEAWAKHLVDVQAAREAAVAKAHEEAEARAKARAEEEERRRKGEEEAALAAAAAEGTAPAAAGTASKAPSRAPSAGKSRASSAKSKKGDGKASRATSAKSVKSTAQPAEEAAAAPAPAPLPEPEPVVIPEFPPLPTAPPAVEPDLHFGEGHAAGLQGALVQVREVKGDPHLQAKALGVLRRLKAASELRQACAAVASARPLPHLRHDVYTWAHAAVEAAVASGVGPTLLAQARLALAVAAGEVELAGAMAVAQGITIGTHEYDAYIARLGAAVESAKVLAAQARAAGTDPAEPEYFSLRAALGVPQGNDIVPPPIKDDVIAEATALLTRLQCEVQVTDSLAEANQAGALAKQAAEAHKEEDPTLLPIPEIPPAPPAPEGAAPAPSRPPSGKGAPAAPVDPAAPPPLNPDFPLDATGVPLPDTPQLLTLKALRKACGTLDGVIATSKAAGADAACIDGAVAGLTVLRAQFDTGLAEEANRVSTVRAEKAKAAKKGKKKGK